MNESEVMEEVPGSEVHSSRVKHTWPVDKSIFLVYIVYTEAMLIGNTKYGTINIDFI